MTWVTAQVFWAFFFLALLLFLWRVPVAEFTSFTAWQSNRLSPNPTHQPPPTPFLLSLNPQSVACLRGPPVLPGSPALRIEQWTSEPQSPVLISPVCLSVSLFLCLCLSQGMWHRGPHSALLQWSPDGGPKGIKGVDADHSPPQKKPHTENHPEENSWAAHPLVPLRRVRLQKDS